MKRGGREVGIFLVLIVAILAEHNTDSARMNHSPVDFIDLTKRWGYYGSGTDQPNTVRPWGGYGPYWNWDFRG